jgi:hypothetical protein
LIPYDLFRVSISNEAQIQPSLIGSDVSDITDPDLFRTIYMKVFNEVRILVEPMI